MRKLRRSLAVLLTAAMVLTLCDLSAFAMWLETGFENGQAVSRIERFEDEDLPAHRLYTAMYDAATGQFRGLGDRDGVPLDFEEDSEIRLFLTSPDAAPLTDGYRALVLTGDTAAVSGDYDALYAEKPVTLTGSVAVRDKLAGAEITVAEGSELSVPEGGDLTVQTPVILRGTLRTDPNSIMQLDEQTGSITLDGGAIRAEGNIDWGDRNRTIRVSDGVEPRLLRNENYDVLAELLADAGLVSVTYEQLTEKQKSGELWNALPDPETVDGWERRRLDCFAMLIASGALDPETVAHPFRPFGKDELEVMLSGIAERFLTDRNGAAYRYDADPDAAALRKYIDGVYDGGDTLFADSYENGEWHRQLEDVFRGFVRLIPRMTDDTTTALTLVCGEYGEPVVKDGKYAGEDGIHGVRFAQPVTLAFDASVSAEETDWLNDFNFENCAFAAGLTVRGVQGKGYGVNLHDSCAGSVTAALPEGVDDPFAVINRVDLRELSGMDSVFAYTPTHINGYRGAALDLWQEIDGEPALVRMESADVYDVSFDWWGWYDEEEGAWTEKEYFILAKNYIYRHNEEENWDFAVGSSENALLLSTVDYEGKLQVAGNVDLSGVKTARGAYMDNGGECWYNAVALGGSRLTVESGFDSGVSVTGTGEVVLDNVRNGSVNVNGVCVGSAHVFSEYPPYGIYTGMEKTVYDENVTGFAVYPGRWDEQTNRPVFPESPLFTMENDGRYEYDLNEYNGVNIFDVRDSWIADPHQVKFTVTLASGAAVTYAPLCYKEGQMAIGKFADQLRGRLTERLAMVDDETFALVTGENGWEEEDLYVDGAYRPDDFAFAVKYGDLRRPERDDDRGEDGYWLTHYARAEEGVRYGTVKTILRNVYRAALKNSEAELPDEVLLIDDWGWENRGDEQTIEFREIHEMLDAFEAALPPPDADELPACDAETMTVCRGDGGETYVTLDGAPLPDANLRELRFTQALTIEIDESALDGALDFRFCRFDKDVTVHAPAATLADENGEPRILDRFALRFHSTCACDGTLRIVEAAEDAALRASAVNRTEQELDDLPREERLRLTAAVCFDAVGISGADGLRIETNDARVSIDMPRGAVTVNGVRCSSEAGFRLNFGHDSEWVYSERENTRRLIGFTSRSTAHGNGYDDNREEQSLNRVLTLGGTARSDLRVRGVVDARELATSGARLIAYNDGGDWSSSYVRLGEGQTLYVDDAEWSLDLHVNGERLDRPEAWWDGEGGMSINTPADMDVSIWQDGADVTDELVREDRGDRFEFRNPQEGERLIDEGSVSRTQVRFQKSGVTVVYDPVPVCWNRVISIGDLGGAMLEWLQENGYGDKTFGGCTVRQYLETDEACAEASAALLERIWTGRDFRDWADPDYRVRIAFVLRLMPEGIAQRYGDPGDILRWGDAKAVMAGLLAALGVNDAAFDDGGREDDWRVHQGDRDFLYEQFLDQLPPITEDVSLVLYRDEGFEYYTWNGEIVESNWIERKTFDGAVAVFYGENTDPNDDWGGKLFFQGCTFNGGLTIHADESLNYGVSFENNCASDAPVQVVTQTEGTAELDGLRGMEVTADNGVSFDARDAEDWAEVRLRRYDVSAADRADERLNFAQAEDGSGEMRIQLRLSGDFVTEDSILALTLDGEPLPFRIANERWEGDGEFAEYVVELTQDGGTWFGREQLGAVALTLRLGGASLTLAPPSAEWERPQP